MQEREDQRSYGLELKNSYQNRAKRILEEKEGEFVSSSELETLRQDGDHQNFVNQAIESLKYERDIEWIEIEGLESFRYNERI